MHYFLKAESSEGGISRPAGGATLEPQFGGRPGAQAWQPRKQWNQHTPENFAGPRPGLGQLQGRDAAQV